MNTSIIDHQSTWEQTFSFLFYSTHCLFPHLVITKRVYAGKFVSDMSNVHYTLHLWSCGLYLNTSVLDHRGKRTKWTDVSALTIFLLYCWGAEQIHIVYSPSCIHNSTHTHTQHRLPPMVHWPVSTLPAVLHIYKGPFVKTKETQPSACTNSGGWSTEFSSLQHRSFTDTAAVLICKINFNFRQMSPSASDMT